MNTRKGIAALTALVAGGLAVSFFDTRRFVVRNYTFASPKLKRDVRCLLLADLHSCEYGRGNRRLLKAIDDIAPELILVAGDMLTGSLTPPEGGDETALSLMTRLAARYPVYYANGNHEQKLIWEEEICGERYARYARGLERAGVRLLHNDSVELPEAGLRITGLMPEREHFTYFRKRPMPRAYLRRTLGAASGSAYQILIAHNPQYFEEYAAWGADLTVSGHVHGGIMRLPFLGGVLSPSLIPFPKYDGGLFVRNGRRMVVSRGLGTHTLRIRIFNPGELICIRLRRAGETDGTGSKAAGV